MAQMVFTQNAVRINVPYNAEFVREIKSLDSKRRQWSPGTKEWIVFEPHVLWAATLTRSYYPDVTEVRSAEFTEKQARTGYQSRSQWRSNYQSGSYDFGSRKATGNPSSNGSSVSTDHQTLFVTPDAPKEVIMSAYRALAKLNHPDKGGDVKQMEAINLAYERIEKTWQYK